VKDRSPTKHSAWQEFLYGREAERDSRRRLQAKFVSYRVHHEARVGAGDVASPDEVRRLLDSAAGAENADEGWESFQAALRAAVDEMTPAEVWAERAMLLPEVRQKLRDWRRDAALDLLEGADAPSQNAEHIAAIAAAVTDDQTTRDGIAAALARDRGVDQTLVEVTGILERDGCRDAAATAKALVGLFRRELKVEKVALQTAMLIRDDNAMNGHQRTRMFRAQVVSLMCVVALLAIVLLAVALLFPVSGKAVVSNERLWVYGFLLGCMGGALSALQRTTTRATRGRIPELREFKVWMWSLPLAGGAAGLAAVPLALAGVIPVKDNVQTVLAAAFVAGFSERLIVRAASTLTSDTGKSAA
jgi:hypothetical protein